MLDKGWSPVSLLIVFKGLGTGLVYILGSAAVVIMLIDSCVTARHLDCKIKQNQLSAQVPRWVCKLETTSQGLNLPALSQMHYVGKEAISLNSS